MDAARALDEDVEDVRVGQLDQRRQLLAQFGARQVLQEDGVEHGTLVLRQVQRQARRDGSVDRKKKENDVDQESRSLLLEKRVPGALLGVEGVEEANAVGQAADLDEVVARQPQHVGAGEVAEGARQRREPVRLQPLRRLRRAGLHAQRLHVILEQQRRADAAPSTSTSSSATSSSSSSSFTVAAVAVAHQRRLGRKRHRFF